MITTSVGIFDHFSEIVHATEILLGCGFSPEELSVVTGDSALLGSETKTGEHRTPSRNLHNHTLRMHSGSYGANAQRLSLKGIGPVAVVGPLAYRLAETVDDTQHGDLVAALIALEVLEDDAEIYAEAIRRGSTLLAVTTVRYLVERAEDVYLLHGAIDVRARVWLWQQQGWNYFNSTLEPYSAAERERERRWHAGERKPGKSWTPYDRDFRSHFYLTYADSEVRYEHYATAYGYGYQLAKDERYEAKEWSAILPHVRHEWEAANGDVWTTVAEAVSYGFLKGREHQTYCVRRSHQPTRC